MALAMPITSEIEIPKGRCESGPFFFIDHRVTQRTEKILACHHDASRSEAEGSAFLQVRFVFGHFSDSLKSVR